MSLAMVVLPSGKCWYPWCGEASKVQERVRSDFSPILLRSQTVWEGNKIPLNFGVMWVIYFIYIYIHTHTEAMIY